VIKGSDTREKPNKNIKIIFEIFSIIFMKKIFIVWGREGELSRYLAKFLGADFKKVYIKKWGPIKLPAFFRYILQSLVTLVIFIKQKPNIIIVQNPPIFLAFLAYLYCTISRAKLAIDSHTAVFLDKKWILFHWLFKFVAKRSTLNTCHNFKNLEILEKWKVKPAMVMQFYNPSYDLKRLNEPMVNKDLDEKIIDNNIMMVNRFANDDDWQTVLETAKLMPEYNFFITGQPNRKDKGKIKKASANVIFTGYLKHEEFLKLMWRCQVILAFTLRRDTVLWSIREIMALKKPFVATDSEVLRYYFKDVALFTQSDSTEMKLRIKEALSSEADIKENINKFLVKEEIRWEKEIATFKKFLR